MGDLIQFRRRPFVFRKIQRLVIRDAIIEEADGGWLSARRRPPGLGWEIEKDGERYTIWRRAVP